MSQYYNYNNYTKEDNYKLIKIGNIFLPSIPFIWYREQEIYCPIEGLFTVPSHTLSKLYGIDDLEHSYTHIVVQRNLCPKNNLYVCLHNLMYYHLHKNADSEILDIPPQFRVNLPFNVMLVPLNGTQIIEVHNGLKADQYVSGSVHIHDSAFSPAGCLHFKIGEKNDGIVSEFICHIVCKQLNVDMVCLFVLFDASGVENIDQQIAEYQSRIEKTEN